jgi:aminotransferase
MTNRFLSPRVQTLPYSGIREIFDLANKMEDVIHFEIGEPDFDTPSEIIEGAYTAAKQGMTHYTSSAGLIALRKQLADKASEELGSAVTPDEIVVTAGAMEALLLSMLVTIGPDDEVLLPSPHWPNYAAHILLAGGSISTIQLNEKSGFQLTANNLEAAVSDCSKGVIVNYPHNPTGAMLSRENLEGIAGVAAKHDLIVYSDEAYRTLVFDGNKVQSIASLPGMRERTIVLRTFSKTFAMTGWRVGYLIAPEDIAQRAAKFHEHTSACTSSLSQSGALAALNLPSNASRAMVTEYQRRRDIMVSRLREMPGLTVHKPEGTFYVFVGIQDLAISSLELAKRLLMEGNVAVAPGSAFGAAGEGYIRICFATSEQNIREGLRRMEPIFRDLANPLG